MFLIIWIRFDTWMVVILVVQKHEILFVVITSSSVTHIKQISMPQSKVHESTMRAAGIVACETGNNTIYFDQTSFAFLKTKLKKLCCSSLCFRCSFLKASDNLENIFVNF